MQRASGENPRALELAAFERGPGSREGTFVALVRELGAVDLRAFGDFGRARVVGVPREPFVPASERATLAHAGAGKAVRGEERAERGADRFDRIRDAREQQLRERLEHAVYDRTGLPLEVVGDARVGALERLVRDGPFQAPLERRIEIATIEQRGGSGRERVAAVAAGDDLGAVVGETRRRFAARGAGLVLALERGLARECLVGVARERGGGHARCDSLGVIRQGFTRGPALAHRLQFCGRRRARTRARTQRDGASGRSPSAGHVPRTPAA